jgi:hypothetical protein
MTDKPYLLRGIPADLLKKARIRAIEEGITLPKLILKAIEAYIKKKSPVV